MPATGILFSPKGGVDGTVGGSSRMPRSIASDGSLLKLSLHVLVHVLALGFHIGATVMMWDSFPQSQVKVGVVVAVVMHGLGIVGVLALASFFTKQIAYTFLMGVVYSFLLSGLMASTAMAVLNYRNDDAFTHQHWLYYGAVYLQTLGLGLVISNSLNMAANGDKALRGSGAETAPLAA